LISSSALKCYHFDVLSCPM